MPTHPSQPRPHNLRLICQLIQPSIYLSVHPLVRLIAHLLFKQLFIINVHELMHSFIRLLKLHENSPNTHAHWSRRSKIGGGRHRSSQIFGYSEDFLPHHLLATLQHLPSWQLLYGFPEGMGRGARGGRGAGCHPPNHLASSLRFCFLSLVSAVGWTRSSLGKWTPEHSGFGSRVWCRKHFWHSWWEIRVEGFSSTSWRCHVWPFSFSLSQWDRRVY